MTNDSLSTEALAGIVVGGVLGFLPGVWVGARIVRRVWLAALSDVSQWQRQSKENDGSGS